MKDRKAENLLGILKVKVVRGVDLAIRDYNTSDPYVIIRMNKHKVKTHVRRNTLNPVWNEDLTLPLEEPTPPIILEVYDKDTFSIDDPMGDAEIDLKPFVEAVKGHLNNNHDNLPITIIPSMQNCFAEASHICYENETIFQNMMIRLRNVETGFLELQLYFSNIGSSRGARA